MSGLWVPERSSVVGSGRMGAGIAHALLMAGSRVRVIDTDEQAVARGLDTVRTMVQASIDRGFDGRVDEILARVDGAVGSASAEGDLVVEAVPESVELKRTVLTAVESVVAEGAVIASNTSSLSISMLADSLVRPQRFLGMHFFNPVPASRLVELVVGSQTAAEVVDRARDVVAAFGKTPIVVADSPGFASSRLGVLLGLEAIRMVEEGVATPDDIDAAMTLGYKHPMGPLRLTDLVGLDVRLGVAEYLAGVLGSRFEPPQLMRDMVARGDLGQKSGRGFYDW